MIQFHVAGTPKPQGSKRAFAFKRSDGSLGATVKESAGDSLKVWRARVREVATRMAQDSVVVPYPRGEPVDVEVVFYLARPKSHFGTGRNAGRVKASAPTRPVTQPDVDKLLRAVLDALTGPMYETDSQVVKVITSKEYADGMLPPGASIAVWLA